MLFLEEKIGMITKIQGQKYNFEIVSENKGEDVCFFIKAIDRHAGRFSCINNLNAISKFEYFKNCLEFESFGLRYCLGFRY